MMGKDKDRQDQEGTSEAGEKRVEHLDRKGAREGPRMKRLIATRVAKTKLEKNEQQLLKTKRSICIYTHDDRII